jgi:hypothetical protein
VAALIDEGWSWSKDHRKMLNLGLFLPPKGSSGGGKIRFNSSVHDTATGNHIRNAASNKRQSRNPRRKNNRNDKANDPHPPNWEYHRANCHSAEQRGHVQGSPALYRSVGSKKPQDGHLQDRIGFVIGNSPAHKIGP